MCGTLEASKLDEDHQNSKFPQCQYTLQWVNCVLTWRGILGLCRNSSSLLNSNFALPWNKIFFFQIFFIKMFFTQGFKKIKYYWCTVPISYYHTCPCRIMAKIPQSTIKSSHLLLVAENQPNPSLLQLTYINHDHEKIQITNVRFFHQRNGFLYSKLWKKIILEAKICTD